MRLPLARGAGIAAVIACACASCGTLTGAPEAATTPADAGSPDVAAPADAAAAEPDAAVEVDAGDPRITAYRALVIGDGPIGYWPFDDPPGSPTARALVGPAGAAQNAPIMGEPGPFGAASRAIRFDGTQDMQIVVSDPSLLFPADSQAVSLECWYLPTVAPDATFRHVFAWYVAPSGFGVYEQQNPGISFERIFNTSKHSVNPGSAPARGQWHHLVVTSLPGKALTIYVDGIATYETGAPGNQTLTGAGPLRIGGKSQTASIVASIAEVAIYAKELSAAEVIAHRARGVVK